MSSADSGGMFCSAVFDLQPNLAGRMHGGMEVVVGGLLGLSANGVSGALARVSFAQGRLPLARQRAPGCTN